MYKDIKEELKKLKRKIEIIKLNIKNEKNIYKPIILLDQDDVIAELVLYVVEEYNTIYGTTYTINDITIWNISSILGKEVLDIMNNKDIFLKLKPVPFMIECLKLLTESDLFNMQMVSAAEYYVWENKCLWVKKYLPFFDLKNMNCCTNKYLFLGDILLDDAPHNLIKFKNGQPIVFDKPYNQEYNNPDLIGLSRIYDWIEFSNYILNKFYNNYCKL